MPEPMPMPPLKPISNENAGIILRNFVEVPNAKALPEFCVDGRKGPRTAKNGAALEGPYMQALGGSFHFSALNWIMGGGQQPYAEVIDNTFTALSEHGYRVSAHTGHHSDHQTTSDCGFDDNFGKIVTVLATQGENIWKTVTTAAPSLAAERANWDDVMKMVGEAAKHLDMVPNGHDMVMNIARGKHDADLQELDGNHNEMAAVVNLKRGTTLDVDKNQDTQAFNLDLWHVLDQAKDLGMDVDKAKLLSLGLYVATEKVLVEEKRGYSIPILVNA